MKQSDKQSKSGLFFDLALSHQQQQHEREQSSNKRVESVAKDPSPLEDGTGEADPHKAIQYQTRLQSKENTRSNKKVIHFTQNLTSDRSKVSIISFVRENPN